MCFDLVSQCWQSTFQIFLSFKGKKLKENEHNEEKKKEKNGEKKREKVSVKNQSIIFHLPAGVKSSPHVPLSQGLTHLSEGEGERNSSPHLSQKTFNS